MAAEIFPKMSISAEWEVAKLWNHLFYRVFWPQFRANISKNLTKIAKTPIFLGSFQTFEKQIFLQHLVVEKDIHFQFQCLYYVYRGLKGFLNVSFWSYLTNPQKAKSLQMDPQNAFRKHLKTPCFIVYSVI